MVCEGEERGEAEAEGGVGWGDEGEGVEEELAEGRRVVSGWWMGRGRGRRGGAYAGGYSFDQGQGSSVVGVLVGGFADQLDGFPSFRWGGFGLELGDMVDQVDERRPV